MTAFDTSDIGEQQMGLFHTDSLVLCCTDVSSEKEWWIRTFKCTEVKRPAGWDCPLPSDVALRLPGAEVATVLLCDRRELKQAGYERENDHPILFCRSVKKAHEELRGRGVMVSPVHRTGGMSYFEVADPEGNSIEICEDI
jgi:hypothetical protein